MSDRSWRLRITCTAALLIAYLGFFGASALAPLTMSSPLLGGSISLEMMLGVAVMAFFVAITGYYAYASEA